MKVSIRRMRAHIWIESSLVQRILKCANTLLCVIHILLCIAVWGSLSASLIIVYYTQCVYSHKWVWPPPPPPALINCNYRNIVVLTTTTTIVTKVHTRAIICGKTILRFCNKYSIIIYNICMRVYNNCLKTHHTKKVKGSLKIFLCAAHALIFRTHRVRSRKFVHFGLKIKSIATKPCVKNIIQLFLTYGQQFSRPSHWQQCARGPQKRNE